MAASKKKNSAAARGKRSSKAPQQNVTIIEMSGFGIICLSVVSFIVLLSMSDPHNPFIAVMKGLAGNLSFLLPFIILWIGLIVTFFRTRKCDFGKIAMLTFCILDIAAIVHVFRADLILSHLQLGSGWLNFVQQSYFERIGAGALGALLSYPVYFFAGKAGGCAILMCLLIGAIMLMIQFSPAQFGERAQEYISNNYSEFKKNQTERSAERAIIRAERRQAAEAERSNRRRESAEWDVPWDEQVISNTPNQKRRSPSAKKSVGTNQPDEPLPRQGNILEIPDYLKDSNRRNRKKPVFGEPQTGDQSTQTEVSSPFSKRGSKLVASVPAPEENVPENPCAEDVPFDMDSLQSDSAEDLPHTEEMLQDPEMQEAFPVDIPDTEAPPFDLDFAEEEDFEEEAEAIPAFSPAFPAFDAEELDAPVQRVRRRDTLGAPVKKEPLQPQKKYAPDDYVPSEEDFDHNPWTYDPARRLDYTPLVSPAKHKGSIYEEGMEYNYPPVDLLSIPKQRKEADREMKDQEKAAKLESTLHDFGINAKLTGIAHGPAVTRFELAPAPGVKVSRITSLADDIALSLAALSVRIEAPIPGKAAVGVEIPNDTVETVPLREVLESSEARKHPSRLAVGMGKDNSGKCIVGDIAKMPHVLIAGATGSGKSVCINCIICSILYRATPEEVRLIMIDPKMVELSIYNGIPHLLVPVVTDPKKASGALQWAVAEMTDRYNKFAERGVRDMKGYNQCLNEGEKPLPQIVIIIDELADLMMVCPGEVEDSICRLAQLARAAGIHLVIATQRPSVNVITGVIKANIPARIAFTVASSVDSRTILDVGGAEKLLGRGDMLFAPAGSNKMQRVQGAWVSDDEVHAIVDYIKARHEADYNDDVIQHMNKAEEAAEADTEENDEDADELLPQAIEIAIEAGQASISMLQRRLRIGYARAGRLIDEMAARGIVSQSEGAKPRNVLITREQYNMMFKNNSID